jgi:hypothetical protein
MDDKKADSKSVVEIDMGHNRVRVEASEEFISQELESILQWTSDYTGSVESEPVRDDSEEEEGVQQTSLEDLGTEPSEEKALHSHTEEESNEHISDEMEEIARSLNVDPSELSKHFYLDSTGAHIQDPTKIEPKYAFLGYCLIEKERTGESYRDNQETKKTLIDEEMVDIDRWGSTFLYRMRNAGLVKNDPRSDKKRNQPFKVTPKGHREFVSWLEENEDDR